MPRVLVPLADGSEELEAVTIIDLLRRAGIEVVVAGLTSDPVQASRGVKIVPDMTLDAALEQDYDMAVIPGGAKGAQALGENARLTALLKKMAESGKFLGAVCAGPTVLAKAGVLDGKRVTAFPGALEELEQPNLKSTGTAIEVDGKVITSRGPGTAMDFALTLIEQLVGKEKRDEVEGRLVRA